MATTNITGAWVFPEDQGTGGHGTGGDKNDAANFAAVFNAIGFNDFVATGLDFTYNSGGPTLDIASGKAVVTDTSATATQTGEARDEGVSYAVEVPAESGLSLDAATVNHVYLNVDLSTDDTAEYVINTTGSAPAQPSLKLGTVDTSSDTVSRVNTGALDDLSLSDDGKFYFGQDNDFSMRFDAGADEWVVRDEDNTTDVLAVPKGEDISTILENNGGYELSLDNLSGDLADPQDPKLHATSHQQGGSDELDADELSGANATTAYQFLRSNGSDVSWELFSAIPRGLESGAWADDGKEYASLQDAVDNASNLVYVGDDAFVGDIDVNTSNFAIIGQTKVQTSSGDYWSASRIESDDTLNGALDLTDASAVYVAGLHIDGQSGAGVSNDGIDFVDKRTRIERCAISDVGFDGIESQNDDGSGTGGYFGEVKDCVFHNVDSEGVRVANVENCYFYQCDVGADIDPLSGTEGGDPDSTDYPQTSGVVNSCTFRNCGTAAIQNARNVTNCYIYEAGGSGNGIECATDDATITGNTIDVSGDGVVLTGTNQVVVGNRVSAGATAIDTSGATTPTTGNNNTN